MQLQCKHNADTSGIAMIKRKMQLVHNTMNMDSSKLDGLYPESDDGKCECE